MKLFYKPKINDHILIKKTNLTGRVVHEGIKVTILLDYSGDILIVPYTRLRPVDKNKWRRRMVREKYQEIVGSIEKLKDTIFG